MADGTLINGETLHGTFTLDKQTGTTLQLNVKDNFVAKNVVLYLAAQLDEPAFDGGGLTSKGATAGFTNMTVSNTDTSGVAIQAKGTAGRAAVLYNGAVNGWVSKSDNASALAAESASTWNGTTYYATGVTIGNNKAFDITVPNGNSTVTFHFAVDGNGNTTITGGD